MIGESAPSESSSTTTNVLENHSFTSVSAVALKLPPFWPDDPQLWFAQVEAQFATRRITSQRTKFDYIIANLEPRFATEVRELILSPPATDPYDVLKKSMVERIAASEQNRIKELLCVEELGDRKPTQLLRRMQQLLGENLSKIDDSFVRQLFLQRLPANVQMVLASVKDLSLFDLAQMADKIMDVSVSGIHHFGTSTNAAVEVKELREQIAELARKIEYLSVGHRSRSSSPRRKPSLSGRNTSSSSECWYHRTFGEQASKCRPPCSKSENGMPGR